MKGPRVSLCVLAAATAALLIPAAGVGQGAGFNPGKWEMTIDLTSMPNLPPAAAQALAGRGGMTVTQCLSRDQVAKGQIAPQNPSAGRRGPSDCDTAKVSMDHGHFTSETVCHVNGNTVNSTVSGTFTDASFAFDSTTVTNGNQAAAQVVKISGRRVGDC